MDGYCRAANHSFSDANSDPAWAATALASRKETPAGGFPIGGGWPGRSPFFGLRAGWLPAIPSLRRVVDRNPPVRCDRDSVRARRSKARAAVRKTGAPGLCLLKKATKGRGDSVSAARCRAETEPGRNWDRVSPGRSFRKGLHRCPARFRRETPKPGEPAPIKRWLRCRGRLPWPCAEAAMPARR